MKNRSAQESTGCLSAEPLVLRRYPEDRAFDQVENCIFNFLQKNLNPCLDDQREKILYITSGRARTAPNVLAGLNDQRGITNVKNTCLDGFREQTL